MFGKIYIEIANFRVNENIIGTKTEVINIGKCVNKFIGLK